MSTTAAEEHLLVRWLGWWVNQAADCIKSLTEQSMPHEPHTPAQTTRCATQHSHQVSPPSPHCPFSWCGELTIRRSKRSSVARLVCESGGSPSMCTLCLSAPPEPHASYPRRSTITLTMTQTSNLSASEMVCHCQRDATS